MLQGLQPIYLYNTVPFEIVINMLQLCYLYGLFIGNRISVQPLSTIISIGFKFMMKKSIFLCLMLSIAGLTNAATPAIEENLFKWATAGQAVSFPQTYILKNDNTTLVSQLEFGDKDSYLAALSKGKATDKNLVPVLKEHFPKVWKSLQQEFKQHEKVILTVSVSKDVADCKPCSMQQGTLQEKNYFDLPHIKLVLTK